MGIFVVNDSYDQGVTTANQLLRYVVQRTYLIVLVSIVDQLTTRSMKTLIVGLTITLSFIY